MIKINFSIKKITIGSTDFDIIWDKKTSSGSFSYPDKKKAFIKIGVEDHKINPLRTFEIIIHELKEIIQLEQSTRYGRADEARNYEFHYTHKEHTDLCSRLAELLNKFIK